MRGKMEEDSQEEDEIDEFIDEIELDE